MSAYDGALDLLKTVREAAIAERAKIEEEVRAFRAERLAASARQARMLILEAYAKGASIAKIKKAYGTRDHATIANAIESGADEIAAIIASNAAPGAPEWFSFPDGKESALVDIDWEGSSARFAIHEFEDGDILLSSNVERIVDGVENKAVAYFDGYTSEEVGEIDAIRVAWEAVE